MVALARKLRDRLATRARALPLARHAWARYRKQKGLDQYGKVPVPAPAGCAHA